MASIETIIRPAQTPEISPPVAAVTRRSNQNWQPVVLRWGVGGSITQMSGSESEQLTLYQVQRPTEKKS